MNGVILLDKPPGITSFQAVSRLRKAMGGVKTGHSGTLDPLATGLLVVLAGEATKIAPYLDEEPKEYEATMRLGVTTDTYDLEGEVLEESVVTADDRSILAVLETMPGKQEQVPPPYSAVKVKGRPLYKYARAGQEVEARPREVEVFSLEVEEVRRKAGACDVLLRLSCSRGTYVRSICHEAGRQLGCGACLAGLRRTRAGSFSLEQALGLEEWCERLERGDTHGMIPIAGALAHMPEIRVEGRTLDLVRNGHPLGSVPGEPGGIVVVSDGAGTPVALHAVAGPGKTATRVLRVLNMGSAPQH